MAWRRFAAGSHGDAILFAKSTDFGRTFTRASVVTPAAGGTFLPFDQASDPAQSPYQTALHTNSYPTLASTGPGRVQLAWAQRPAAGGFARIVMTTSTDGGNTWSAPAAVDGAPILDDATPQAGSFDRAHQFTPQLNFSAGRLFRYGSNQYTFNWDTASTVVRGCYTIELQLSDGSPVKATNVLLRQAPGPGLRRASRRRAPAARPRPSTRLSAQCATGAGAHVRGGQERLGRSCPP